MITFQGYILGALLLVVIVLELRNSFCHKMHLSPSINVFCYWVKIFLFLFGILPVTLLPVHVFTFCYLLLYAF